MNIINLKGAIPDIVYNKLDIIIDNFEINNLLRMSHFLSQCSHESNNFKVVEENLNYSSERLLVIFPRYFTKDTAKEYARNPKKIADLVYSNRMGNGPNEGYLYRGRGYIQLTGKNNYKNFGDSINVDLVSNPDLVATTYPLSSSAWYFKSRNILTVCDKGSDIKTIEAVTKLVNGGLIGINEREKSFNFFFKLLSK